ncbi:MAG: hypothetical protein MRJ93_14995, partial [Nitrososphaeraceae archaeon]|nr:hypothetical protein [Nitrososphaeraceae archaeon]
VRDCDSINSKLIISQIVEVKSIITFSYLHPDLIVVHLMINKNYNNKNPEVYLMDSSPILSS